MTHNPKQKFETKLLRGNRSTNSTFFYFFFYRLGQMNSDRQGDKLVKERNILRATRQIK